MANVSSSNGKGANHPKLRFKGFSEPWKLQSAEKLFENIVDKNHPDDTVLTIVQGSGTLPRSESSRNIRYDEKGVANYKKVNTYDYIIHLRSFEGGLEMANSQGIISPAYTVLRSKIEFAPLFYDAYFHTDEFINHILAKSVEGIRDGRQISYEAFKWLPIPTCNIEEQKKIADLFCVLNKRIKAQLLLVEALKKYKRGVLQKLFTSNNSIWKKAQFGNFFTEHTEKTTDTETYPICSLTVEDGIILKPEKYFREFLITKEGESYKILRNNWFAYNPMNAHIGAIAPNVTGIDVSVSGYYNIFSVKHPETVTFWKEYLKCYNMLCYYKVIATGSLVEKQRVHYSQFINIEMPLPSIKEQEEISLLLHSLNNKLKNAEYLYINLLKLKSGFLQKLFI